MEKENPYLFCSTHQFSNILKTTGDTLLIYSRLNSIRFIGIDISTSHDLVRTRWTQLNNNNTLSLLKQKLFNCGIKKISQKDKGTTFRGGLFTDKNKSVRFTCE